MVLIDSMPPAMTTSALPLASSSPASIIVFIPDGQAILTVNTGTFDRHPAPDGGGSRRIRSVAGLAAIAEDHLIHPRAGKARALQRGTNGGRAQVIGRNVLEGPAEAAQRRADGGDGDDIVVHEGVS